MAVHNVRGREGEQLAWQYFLRHGFVVLYANWTHRRHEIDLIATKDNILHFIEVKTRHSLRFGYPEESVTRKKFRNIKKCAMAFLCAHPGWQKIQYDILSIVRLRGKPDEFLFIEDVFLF